MSIDNFIPTIWSARILMALEKALVFGNAANRYYEGEIANEGSQVKINGIGDVTINDYSGEDITIQDLQDASQIMNIDQKKYFAFQIDDVDKAQAKPKGIMQAAMNNGGYGLRNVADQFLAAKHGDAGIKTGLGTDTTPLTITSANALSTVALVKRYLDDANVPEDGRWMIVPPWFVEKLILAEVIRATDNKDVLENGRVANLFGISIQMSNNVVNTSGAKYKIMAGYRGTMTFAQQILKVKAFEPEKRFSDAVKGLYVYGGKIVRANTLARVIANPGTESSI